VIAYSDHRNTISGSTSQPRGTKSFTRFHLKHLQNLILLSMPLGNLPHDKVHKNARKHHDMPLSHSSPTTKVMT